jgi:NADH:ubiquinone oxidoreductase subunit E
MKWFGSDRKDEVFEAIKKSMDAQDNLIKTLMEIQTKHGEEINKIYELMIEQAKVTATHKIIIMNLVSRADMTTEILKQIKELEMIK